MATITSTFQANGANYVRALPQISRPTQRPTPSMSENGIADDSNLKVTRSCDPCRKKKCRCNNVLPQCARCDRLGLNCTYLREPKRRGPPKGSPSVVHRRLRALESISSSLGIDPRDVDALERAVVEPETKISVAPQKADLKTETIDKSVQDLVAGSQMDLGIFDLKFHSTWHYVPILTVLLELYFANIHTFLPMISAENIVNSLSVQGLQPNMAFLLISMYTLATPFLGTHESQSAHHAENFYKWAKDLMDVGYSQPDLRSVQGLLNLATYEVATRGFSSASDMTLSQAIMLARRVGIDKPLNTLTEDTTEGLQTFWCLFMVDKYHSAFLNRTPLISLEDAKHIGIPPGMDEVMLPLQLVFAQAQTVKVCHRTLEPSELLTILQSLSVYETQLVDSHQGVWFSSLISLTYIAVGRNNNVLQGCYLPAIQRAVAHADPLGFINFGSAFCCAGAYRLGNSLICNSLADEQSILLLIAALQGNAVRWRAAGQYAIALQLAWDEAKKNITFQNNN